MVGVAAKVMLPPAQIEVAVDVIDTVGVTVVIVIVTGALVAVGVVMQLALLVITTVTTSLFLSVDDVNVAFVAPATGLPLIIHWYVGVVPPSVAVDEKVTVVPLHTGFWSAAIVIVGVTVDVVIFMGLLVAVAGLAQASLLVITTVTASLLASVVDVKVAAVWPATALPLIIHW